MSSVPKIGDRYKHRNGNMYTVIIIANEFSDRDEYPVTVVYQGDNGKVWAKPWHNFISRMTKV